jgi:uncharacterized membrane protein
MRGTPRKASTLFNLVDGIFAVAVTLIPISIPNSFLESNQHGLLLLNSSIVVIGLTMALMWHKLRSILKVSSPVNSLELALVAIVCILVVMIPKCALLAFKYGTTEGSIWHWNLSESVNIEYQGLIVIYELITFALMVSALRKKSAAKFSAFQLRGFKLVELAGLALIGAIILCENLLIGANGVYLYFFPLVLAAEEVGYILVHKKSEGIDGIG